MKLNSSKVYTIDSLAVHTGSTLAGPDQLLAENSKISFCAFTSELVNVVNTDTSILTWMTHAFVDILLTEVTLVTCKYTVKISPW